MPGNIAWIGVDLGRAWRASPDIRNLAACGAPAGLGVLAGLCAATVVGSAGCARFNDAQSQPFTTEPEMAPPPTSTPPPPPPLPAKPFPKACPAPGVMQGCLESTSGLIMGADSKTALVAERTTGAVKEVSRQRRAQGQDWSSRSTRPATAG